MSKTHLLSDPVGLPEPGLSRKRKARNLSLSLAAAAAIFILLNENALQGIPRLCLWHTLSGTDCPFCGLIRSLVALGDGDLAGSLRNHPFGPPVALMGLAALAGSLRRWLGGDNYAEPDLFEKNSGKIALAIGALWLFWWLLGFI